MLTPEIVSATAKSDCVTSRANRILNASWRVVECRPAQRHAANVGWRWRKCRWKLVPDGRILRTGIGDALGFVALTAPCSGSSGLPKEIAAFSGAAVAAVGAVTTPAAAVVTNTSRLDIILVYSSGLDEGDLL